MRAKAQKKAPGATIENQQYESSKLGREQGTAHEKDQEMGELHSERELINLAIKLKRKQLQCTTCNTTDTMIKNGGGGSQNRAWKCMLCGKQISGRTIPQMLAKQLGEDWKTEVAQVEGLQLEPTADESEEEQEPKGQNDASTEQDKRIEVDQSAWHALVQKMKNLTQQHARLGDR